jgi:hypothetical protein
MAGYTLELKIILTLIRVPSASFGLLPPGFNSLEVLLAVPIDEHGVGISELGDPADADADICQFLSLGPRGIVGESVS